MPPKTREYYLTTSSRRDFTWLFFRLPARPHPPRKKAEPTPPYRVSKPRRGRMPSVKAGQSQALIMAPANVKAVAHAARPKSEPARPRRTSSKKASSKNAGPWSEWSDWYVSDDRSFFWRARQSQDSKLDQKTSPVTMSHELTRSCQKPGTTSSHQAAKNLTNLKNPSSSKTVSETPQLQPQSPTTSSFDHSLHLQQIHHPPAPTLAKLET